MNVAKAVLTKGPGVGIIDNEKMPSIMSIRYWPS